MSLGEVNPIKDLTILPIPRKHSRPLLSSALKVLNAEKPHQVEIKPYHVESLNRQVHQKMKELAIDNSTKDQLLQKVKENKAQLPQWEGTPLEKKLRAKGIVLIAVILVTLIVACVLASQGFFIAAIPWVVAAGIAYVPARNVFSVYGKNNLEPLYEQWEKDVATPKYLEFLKYFSSNWNMDQSSLERVHDSIDCYNLWCLYSTNQRELFLALEEKLAAEFHLTKKQVVYAPRKTKPIVAKPSKKRKVDTQEEILLSRKEVGRLIQRVRRQIQDQTRSSHLEGHIDL